MVCMNEDIKKILAKLDDMKSELDYIKQNMLEKDDIMSNEEFLAYSRSKKKENLLLIEDAEKELDL